MVGIIGAMDVEIEVLKKNLNERTELKIANRTFYKGLINNKEVIVVCAGIGKVNASITASLLLSNFDIDYVINIGVAGGIKPVNSLDLVISEGLIYGDFDLTAFGDKLGHVQGYPEIFYADKVLISKCEKIASESLISYKKGLINTQDKFITDINDLKPILSIYDNVLATEMEGCAIAHACYVFNKPFVVLRTISDVLGEENQVDNYQNALKKAVIIASSLISKLI